MKTRPALRAFVMFMAGYAVSLIAYHSREFRRTWERTAREKGVNSWHHKD